MSEIESNSGQTASPIIQRPSPSLYNSLSLDDIYSHEKLVIETKSSLKCEIVSLNKGNRKTIHVSVTTKIDLDYELFQYPTIMRKDRIIFLETL